MFFLLPFAFCSLPFGKGWGCVSAQTIDSAEYFFDIDPGIGNGTLIPLTLTDSTSDSMLISTEGLSTGFHNLFFRVRDTNKTWSLYEGDRLYIYDTIVAASALFDSSAGEYFYDTDPGVGNGLSLTITPNDSILDTVVASTAGLNSGFHTIFYRVKDSNNVWSLYEGARFYLFDTIAQTTPSSPPLAKAEYFYDTDPGIGNGISLANFSLADSIILNATLPTAPLTAGAHNLFVRVQDTMKVWSLYEGKSFIICNFIPIADFSADTVCINSPTTFTDLSTNLDTSALYTYAWDFNNDGISDDTTKGNTTHVFPTPGTHNVALVVNNTSGCIDAVLKTIYVDSLPIVILNIPMDTICANDTLLLSGGSPAGGTYSGIAVHNGIFYPDSVSSGNHIIYYTYNDINSCSASSYSKIYVSYCTGINELQVSGFQFQVSPNPFRESAVLKIEGYKSIGEIRMNLFNVFGQEVYQSPITGNSLSIPRGNLASGVYFLKISAEGKNLAEGKFIAVD